MINCKRHERFIDGFVCQLNVRATAKYLDPSFALTNSSKKVVNSGELNYFAYL